MRGFAFARGLAAAVLISPLAWATTYQFGPTGGFVAGQSDPSHVALDGNCGTVYIPPCATGSFAFLVVNSGLYQGGTILLVPPDSATGTLQPDGSIKLDATVFTITATGLSQFPSVTVTNKGDAGVGTCAIPSCSTNGLIAVGNQVTLNMSVQVTTKQNAIVTYNVSWFWRLTPQSDATQTPPTYPSGFAQAAPSDTVYVVNSAPTGCVFGNKGPAVFKIPITRFVGQTNDDGTLAQPALLKMNHVISGYARLTMPVWDVDSVEKEVDVVTVNGKRLDPQSTLTGINLGWQLNEFLIPIEYLKFPSLSPNIGETPDVANVNTIQIDIDTATPTHDAYCTAFDWVQLSFSAIAPVVLVHGTNADHTSWDDTPAFKAELDAAGVPYHYNTVDLGKNSSADTNANNLCTKLNQLAVWFGTTKFHLITHSKGATDSRRFFNQNYRNPGCVVGDGTPDQQFRVLSLTSLDTPSQGTMLSDVAVATANTPLLTPSTDPDVRRLLASSWLASWAGAPQDPALTLQTIAGMQAFNAANTVKPQGTRYFSVAADADANQDGQVDCSEAKPLLPAGACALADNMYQVLGNVTSVSVVQIPQGDGSSQDTFTFVEATRGPFMPNDLTSTVASTHFTRDFEAILTTVANHSSVKSGATADAVLQKLQEAFPIGMYPP